MLTLFAAPERTRWLQIGRPASNRVITSGSVSATNGTTSASRSLKLSESAGEHARGLERQDRCGARHAAGPEHCLAGWHRCDPHQVAGAQGVQLTMKGHAIFQSILKLLLAE